ncbi:MAG TPA: cobalamin-independent methionine synthase II family protein [Solirubrobacteraceae bacterium]|jgi:5-methyltetrahydropteroyltriglutamate--homocysteine methyltransferase|nr:cobalamin-independent methionine synthase II family protein [Solirubrobacteraceae bacterium]
MASTGRVRTSHAGSLPRPEGLIELNRRRLDEEAFDPAEYAETLRAATAEVVARQAQIGIDLPNDGEYGHTMGQKVDYGAWWSYSFGRVEGLGRLVTMDEVPAAAPAQGIQLASFPERRDWNLFADAYQDPDAGVAPKGKSAKGQTESGMMLPVCDAPLRYVGQAEVARDVDNMRAAMDAAGVQRGFLCALGVGSAARVGNTHYPTEEEFLWAWADVMREEYEAIADAGLIVQIDEPGFAEAWDQFNPEPSLADYRAYTRVRIEALNHALRNVPRELVRFHCCWGSWHGPHVTDIPLADVADLLLEIDAGSYSFEAANVRHEHEWRVWEAVELPADRVLVPGVVSHATNVVEHPDLVADRIERFARVVGPERVIAGTDCGLGGRVHPQIAWAKLEALVEGARRFNGG